MVTKKKKKKGKAAPASPTLTWLVTSTSSDGEIEDVVQRAFNAVFLDPHRNYVCNFEKTQIQTVLEEGILEYLTAAVVEEVRDAVKEAGEKEVPEPRTTFGQEGVLPEGSSSEARAPMPLLDAASWYDIVERVAFDTDEEMSNVLEGETNSEGLTPLLSVVAYLEKMGAVRAEPEEQPDDMQELDIGAGDRVLAVLEESGEWHEAVVKEVDVQVPLHAERAKEGAKHYLVVFTEWEKPQIVSEDNCVHEDDVVDESGTTAKSREGSSGAEGECPICHRIGKLSYHHLIPRATHAAYLKKGLTPQMKGLRENFAKEWGCSTDHVSERLFLGKHGVDLCRKCHSHVHRAESEKSLAKDWNTLELLLSHPQIQKWAKYASKQKSYLKR